MSAKDFIPHQIGLAGAQLKKVVQGLPINLSHGQMGSAAGDVVLMLHPQNARKMLTAYSKGKGMRLHLSPHEIEHSIHHGRGVVDMAKKVGAAMGNPNAGVAAGMMLGAAGDSALDSGDVRVGASHLSGSAQKEGRQIAKAALDQNIKKLPKEYQAVAERAVAIQIPARADNGLGIRGRGTRLLDQPFSINEAGHFFRHEIPHLFRKGKGMGSGISGCGKGSEEMREKMARLRSMRKTGGKINWDPLHVGDKIKASNAKIASVFTPALGDKIVSGLKTGAHYIIPAAAGALGGLAGTALGTLIDPAGGEVVGGIMGSAAGSYAGNKLNQKLGIGMRRGRGRPRKGTGVAMSGAYQHAMKMNFDGLQLSNISGDNQPISAFRRDGRVKPSSTEMTMSPYASMSSPQMNPFIPTSYTQEGGQGSGYGGAGMRRHRGKGLYGAGLYGAGMY